MATRNRYAEIMAQYAQSQPFSFFGYPQTYSGGFTANPLTYTGGFTPYQRLVTPQPALPVEEIPTAPTTGGGGGREPSESRYTPVSPLATAESGSPTFQALDAYGQTIVLPGAMLAKAISQNMLPGELAQAGVNSAKAMETAKEGYASGLLFGAPPSDVSTFAGGGYGVPGAMTTPTGAGIPANPMSVDPAQAAQAIAAEQAKVSAADQAETQSLLNRYPALVAPPAPVVTAPIVEAPAPVVTAPIVEAPAITEGLLSTPQEVAANEAEIQSLLNRYPALVAPPAPVIEAPTPVVAPAPAPTPAYVAPAPEPVQMVNVTERWNGEDAPEGGGWSRVNLGRGEVGYQRTVSVPVSGGGASGGGSGGYTVGGYAPGSQAAAAAASGQFGMGPGTPGFNSGGDGFAQGGHVSMMHLQGPNPMGPDDGYAALKDGEYVINDKAVKKYGIELMNLINSGKISKGKLRGLLEM